MLGGASYDKVNQSYELNSKSDHSLNVKEVGNDNADDDGIPMLNEQRATYSSSSFAAQWPSQPGTLVEDPRWELLYDLYDSFLVIIAIILILKTSLCIYAFNKDKAYTGKYLDAVSPLTLNLIQFNEQASILHHHPWPVS